MTYPATIPLTYDAVDIQLSDYGLFLEITQGLNEVADVRGKDVTVPGSDGQIPRNRRPHQRRIILTGVVIGTGADEAARQDSYRTRWRLLNDLFDPVRAPADLVATLEDGDTATIAARPLNIVSNEIIKSEYAQISVELFSVAPNWTYT